MLRAIGVKVMIASTVMVHSSVRRHRAARLQHHIASGVPTVSVRNDSVCNVYNACNLNNLQENFTKAARADRHGGHASWLVERACEVREAEALAAGGRG